MAKPKTEKPKVTKEPKPVEIQEPAIALAPPESYSMGTWNGAEQIKCKLCPWDTLRGIRAFSEHFNAKHRGG